MSKVAGFPIRKTEETQADRLLTIEQAALALGISAKSLRHRIARRQIEFRKMGRRVVFSERALMNYISGLPRFEATE
jgi:excisionase family DNA binding protein